MYKIGFDIISDLDLHSHAYCCPLTVSVGNVDLMEGIDADYSHLMKLWQKVCIL